LPMTGRASAAPQASTLAFLRRRLGVWFHIVDPRFVTLDADDGENDHRCGLFAACGTAEARSTSVVGKFENNTHVGGPAIVRAPESYGPLSADARTSALAQVSRRRVNAPLTAPA
jgi:hypothetical protein